MKSISIILLVLIVVAIAVLISFMGSLSTYDTVQSAKRNPGAFVHLVASLDHRQPIEYDALKDPNYLSFTVVDTLGHRVKVVYRNARPENLETSERLVLKGAIKSGYFECTEIVMKCPSKYKEESGYAAKKLPHNPYY
jgi:cytochrome c-type biogenesis protein CcmE